MRVHSAEEQRATRRIAGSRRWFLAVVLFFLFAAGVYEWATPFFEKPDESEHFYFALHLAREQRLPVQSAASKSTPWKQEASQPPLYHWLASLVLWPLREEIPYDALAENPHAAIGQPLAPDNKNAFLHPPTTELPAAFVWGVHLARWLSVVMGVLTVWATWRMARLLLPTMPETALFITAWLAALPQFLFISSAVSNDATVTALATLCLWLRNAALGRAGGGAGAGQTERALLSGGCRSGVASAGMARQACTPSRAPAGRAGRHWRRRARHRGLVVLAQLDALRRPHRRFGDVGDCGAV